MKKLISVLLLLFCAATTWAADHDLSEGTPFTFNWTSDKANSTCAPWENKAVDTNLPAGLKAIIGGTNVTNTTNTVTFAGKCAISVTFLYTDGTQRLDMWGVDVLDASGNLVSTDYHHGYTGTKKENNVYEVAVYAAGDYTIRYWVSKGDYLYDTFGTVTVDDMDFAAYERNIAVKRITPVIDNIRTGLGVIAVTADKLSTNGALSGSAGSLADLLDGNNNTEFVTTWQTSAGESHYIQVDLGTEDLGMDEFSLMWVNRSNGRDGLYAGNIKASTDGSNWDTLKEIVDGEVSKEASAKIQIDGLSLKNSSDVQYRYIRLTCTYGQFKLPADNEYCFGLAELTVKGTLSAEEQQLSDMCDAAQAVVDNAESTAAQIDEQFWIIKQATTVKPEYPFTLTTDDANPVLYVLKSGRDNNPCYTLTDDGHISLKAYSADDKQAWYFKEVQNADGEYVLKIVPYAEPETTIGYTSTSNQPNLVSNSTTNYYDEWILDQNFENLGIKPYWDQSTYLSNNGGVSNNMGFWWQDPDVDPGTALYIISASEAINDELERLIAHAKTFQVGTTVGSYTESSVQALALAISAAEAATTYEQKKVAIANLTNTINNSEVILPEEGKFYNMVNVYETAGVVYAGADGKVYWEQDKSGSSAVWQFKSNGDGSYEIFNVHNQQYLKTFVWSQPAILGDDSDCNIVLTSLGDRMFTIISNPEGDMRTMHAQGGGALVYYNDVTKGNASSWYINEVTEFSHTLNVTEAGWATLVLGFNATIPTTEGFKAYTVSSIEDGYVALEEATGVLKANTAIIVNAPKGEYEFTYSADEATVTESLLYGSLYNKNITPEGTAYVLGNVENNVGLYKATLNQAENTAFLNNANKAYLVVANANPAAQYSFRFEDGTTGVEKVEIRNEKSEIYDLTGRRVENPSNGIYIINGVKVLVK